MLVCEAATLEPHQKYLQDHGWSFCFNDAKDLCVLASLGKDGSIVQIGGPKEDDVWSGPNRKISFGIFEICWGQASPDQPLQHQVLVTSIEMWRQIWLTWKEQE